MATTSKKITSNITTNITGGGSGTTISASDLYNLQQQITTAGSINNGIYHSTLNPWSTYPGTTYPGTYPNSGTWNVTGMLPSSDEVAQTNTVYPTPLNITNPVHHHHYDVWKTLNPDVPHRFFALFEDSSTHNNVRQLCFLEAEHYESFRAFWNDYEARFNGEVLNAYYPDFQNGAAHLVKACGLKVNDQWKWIVENCKEPVWHAGGLWLFVSDRDKSKFTLTWTQ